jgi:NitT/TauT family transport system ATP-binding protein/sulfonate transport system ATP-binding protein
MTIQLSNIDMFFQQHKRGEATQALAGLDLTIAEGEFTCLLGPSGCGKSTALNLVAGFARPTSGEVLVHGQSVHQPGPDRGVVFQEHNLFPWLTVWENVVFGPKVRGVSASAYTESAREQIRIVGLEGFEKHLPKQLSGGMRQRCAIARALVNDPGTLLMDEPFGALDAQTRMVMQELVLKLWEQDRKTVLFITHDIDEALLLADTIHVMTARPGTVKQTIPNTLARPRNYDVVASREFVEMKKQILGLIRTETTTAIARGE